MMKSFIFCTSFIQKNNWSLFRWNRWIRYYSGRKELFGAERIFLIDDATPLGNIKIKAQVIDVSKPLPTVLPDGIIMFRFPEHYGRYKTRIFPGWRRSFTFAAKIAKQYSFDKIIHIESDAFVVRKRMAEYIKHLRKGWTVFWCPGYNFPETSIQIICNDSICKVERLYGLGKKFWFHPAFPELTLPFTNINKRFIGNRYSDFFTPAQTNADYICQAHCKIKLEDKLKLPKAKIGHAG